MFFFWQCIHSETGRSVRLSNVFLAASLPRFLSLSLFPLFSHSFLFLSLLLFPSLSLFLSLSFNRTAVQGILVQSLWRRCTSPCNRRIWWIGFYWPQSCLQIDLPSGQDYCLIEPRYVLILTYTERCRNLSHGSRVCLCVEVDCMSELWVHWHRERFPLFDCIHKKTKG